MDFGNLVCQFSPVSSVVSYGDGNSVDARVGLWEIVLLALSLRVYSH